MLFIDNIQSIIGMNIGASDVLAYKDTIPIIEYMCCTITNSKTVYYKECTDDTHGKYVILKVKC